MSSAPLYVKQALRFSRTVAAFSFHTLPVVRLVPHASLITCQPSSRRTDAFFPLSPRPAVSLLFINQIVLLYAFPIRDPVVTCQAHDGFSLHLSDPSFPSCQNSWSCFPPATVRFLMPPKFSVPAMNYSLTLLQIQEGVPLCSASRPYGPAFLSTSFLP